MRGKLYCSSCHSFMWELLKEVRPEPVTFPATWEEYEAEVSAWLWICQSMLGTP